MRKMRKPSSFQILTGTAQVVPCFKSHRELREPFLGDDFFELYFIVVAVFDFFVFNADSRAEGVEFQSTRIAFCHFER